ncbi:MAG: hypothetical protein QW791_04520 [Candidatus Bathyarchaeia archaeon]
MDAEAATAKTIKATPAKTRTAAKPITKTDRGFISKSILALSNISSTPTAMRTNAASNIFQENSYLLPNLQHH